MDDNYYTPELEEFHIGFEYEKRNAYDTSESWEKEVMINADYLIAEIFDKTYLTRVKYLDANDILSEGFKVYITPKRELEKSKDWTIFYKDDLRIHFQNRTLLILKKDKGRTPYAEGDFKMKVLFHGTIKNKSEFRKILKQVS